MNTASESPSSESLSAESSPLESIAGLRIALVGRLASMSRRAAQQLLRERGGIVVERPEGLPQWIVVGEDRWPAGATAPTLDEPWRLAAEAPTVAVLSETQLWQRLGLVDDQRHVQRLYTPAMLAELVGIPLATVRQWHRHGLIESVRQVRRLPYFDFREVAVARRLQELQAAGLSPRAIERHVAQLARMLPGVERPLADLPLVVEGRSLLLRQGDGLVESGGQLRFDYDAEPAALPTDDVASDLPRTPGELCVWAAELDEAGQLDQAVETYRAALAAGGPEADTCFALAELLYRQGDVSAALERYYMAIELDEDFVEARANLGCVLAETGRRELAVAAFEGALAFHEDYADVHYHLARTLDELARPTAAETHWRAFLDLAPDSPWAETAHQRLSTLAEVVGPQRAAGFIPAVGGDF